MAQNNPVLHRVIFKGNINLMPQTLGNDVDFYCEFPHRA